jgi:hypothetical protein
VIQIDLLPDDVLLEIFDFYVKKRSLFDTKTEVEKWQSLVHVCRRWRRVVFGSPNRLNLQLYCTPQTPSRDTLDVWPALPLLIQGSMTESSSADDITVALGHSNRVCEVHLWVTDRRRLETVLAAMQVPFPELTNLFLHGKKDETPPAIPDSFLGGSAPRLRVFQLFGVPFPGLPTLHLSATHLATLHLFNIPRSGYHSPEAMVALLSMLSSLETLSLGFESPQSRPDWESRRPPPLKRSVVPSLTRFSFKGVSEYLEDLVTCIDAPQLDYSHIIFFNQIDFDTPRLAQFINRTSRFRARDEAHVQFDDSVVEVKFTNRTHESGYPSLIRISCREPDWQLSSIAQVCNSSLPPISMVKDLHVEHEYAQVVWKNDAIENTLWLELLIPFTAVKNLYLAKDFAPGIAAALQELVGGRITEVLPGLRNVFVQGTEPQGPFREHIGKFVAARQLSGHPVAISVWNEEGKEIALPLFVPPTAETVEN